ncbi:hypothetical protein [Streptomyces sp. NPDC056401]|uniref:hypothetical protein n=1 Tax=Streptomyces sp. NPDC056401 TaxID=3345809 RepID=UPI0035D5785D
MAHWIEDPSMDAPDGHRWVRPAPADCEQCLCHTARVCTELRWREAVRPTYSDGTPYTDPCPCERAASVPEPRTVHIELDGVLREVPAEYHRSGLLAGRLRTTRTFRAENPDLGECPKAVSMVLHRPTDATEPRLVVIDGTGTQWVMSFAVQYALQPYRITGWYPG